MQSLTVHSTVVDGRLILEDSPLVRAAREGNVLVVDEADKAPLHVVAVLKSLLDIGVSFSAYLNINLCIRHENIAHKIYFHRCAQRD